MKTLRDWNSLNKEFQNNSFKYEKLRSHFASFASGVKQIMEAQHYHISGASVTLNLDDDYFTVDVLGISVAFEFCAFFNTQNVIGGKVRCHLHRVFPFDQWQSLSEFEFDSSAKSNLTSSNNSSELYISDGFEGVHIVLDVLHDALTSKA